jgi:HlyD family secretion protein
MKTWLRRFGILAAVLVGAAAFYSFGKAYLWQVPEPGVIHSVGIIEAQEVNVSSRIEGRIAVLTLNEGDMVETGQAVCHIEDIDIRNQLAKAGAELTNATAELNDAERTRRRNQGLFAETVISVQAYDNALTGRKGSGGGPGGAGQP